MSIALELWPKSKLKYVVSLRRERLDEENNATRPYIGLEQIESGTGRLTDEANTSNGSGATRTMGESLSNTFEPGDVLFGKLRPYLAKAWLAEFSGRCTTELLVMKPIAIDPRFLRYICLSRTFVDAVDASTFGTKMPRAEWDFIGNLRIPRPDRRQQAAAANALDRVTTRIDALLSAKTRELDLLREKRRAIISHAVSRGLDPTCTYRDSGSSWLGRIPSHWETDRARWLFVERDERSETGTEELLSVSHLTGVTRRSEKDVTMFEAESTEGYKICRAGDLVINTLWAWMGAMGVSSIAGIVSPAYNVYTPGPRLDPSFVDALVRIPAFAQEVRRYSKGVWSSRLRLYPEGFFQVMLPVPSIREQRDIVSHIGAQLVQLDALRSATDRSISLLKERRAALIDAAVNGQLGNRVSQ